MKYSTIPLATMVFAFVIIALVSGGSCSNAGPGFTKVEYRCDGPLQTGYYAVYTSSHLDTTMQSGILLVVNIGNRKGFVPDDRLFKNWHADRFVFSDGQIVERLSAHSEQTASDQTHFLWSVTDEKATIWLFVGTQDEWKKAPAP